MLHQMTRNSAYHLRIRPIARRLLGDSGPRSSEALMLLAIFAAQKPGILTTNYKTGKELNRANRKACEAMTALKKAFARFVALDGTDDDLVRANVQSCLALAPAGDGWCVTFTPRPGATLRDAVYWLVNRAAHNIEEHGRYVVKKRRREEREAREAVTARHHAAKQAERVQAYQEKQHEAFGEGAQVKPANTAHRFQPGWSAKPVVHGEEE